VIRIHKEAAPAALIRAGKEHAEELCAAYDADPDLYVSGQRKLLIKSSIYASRAVKAALDASHHGKCCYCETLIPRPYAYSHVEHWRPKSSARQTRDDESIRPGYYWLAYNWDNLLLSCSFCNSENKSDLFPLDNPAMRALHHRMSIDDEVPAILKPDGGEDPRDHIVFRLEVPVGLTPLGSNTIEVLRLDKHEARLTHLKRIRETREYFNYLMNIDDPEAQAWAERFHQELMEAVRPDKPYSAMVADYLEANPLPDRPA
jgi:uncharacterized protein (TIGR02646 family)